MTKYGSPQQQGSRSLDVAKGILVGLRRCEPDAAFYELVAVAHRYQVPLIAMSAALIAEASGDTQAHAPDSAAQQAARHEWRNLLAQAARGADPRECATSTTAPDD